MLGNAVNTVEGTIGYSMADHSVSFNWAWTADGPKPEQSSVQVESVTFWPTAAISAGTSRALIAGKRRSGNTVIELWTFAKPIVHRGTLNASGEWVYPEMHIDITSRKTILEEDTAGRRVVSAMFFNPAPASGAEVSLFALFDDSRDLCRLDFATSGSVSVQRLYAKVSGSGVPEIQSLACDYDSYWSGNHTQHGYVYVLRSGLNEGRNCPLLVLLDRNRDGTIDSDGVLLPDGPTWTSSGLADAVQYLEIY
ncbi:MAG: hypothetical protein JNL28_00465 [Planctomycetes bacterium]|nr:hypothetical protein [Planctomycetota bacterium]